jgi:tetratricopeptide (TPR) repeat protein
MRKATIGIMILVFSLPLTCFCKSSGDAESYESTIKDSNKAIEINPKDAEAYYNRGKAKASLGDRIGSMKDFNKAIDLKPKNADAYYSRGFLKSNLEDYSGAIKDFNKVITLDPKGAVPYYSRGVTKNQLGDKKGALEDLSKAGELGYSEAYELIRKIQAHGATDKTLNTSASESLKPAAALTDADCDANKLFTPVAGRYGLNPSLLFSHGGGATSVSFGLAAEALVIDQLSVLTSFSLGYADSGGTSATSFTFLGGLKLYALKEGHALPYFQLAGGLMYISSGGASATAGVFSPGVGLTVPLNNYLTANIEVDPAIVFNNGANFYIYTTIGMGFWF